MLLDGTAGDPVVQRMRSELKILGVEVRVASAGEVSPGCDALVVSQPGQVVIRLAGEHGGGEVRVETERDERPELLALAAVELVRARILHSTIAPPKAPPAATAFDEAGGATEPPSERQGTEPTEPQLRVEAPAEASVVTDSRPDAEPKWGLSLGPAALFSPGGVPLTPALLAGLELAPGRRWYLGAHLLATLGATSWSVGGGRLEHGAQLAAARGGGSVWFAQRRAAMRLGVGAAVLRARYRALLASPVFVGDDGTRWAAVPHLEAWLSWYPHQNVGVRVGGLAGVTAPEVQYPHPTREQVVSVPVEPRETRFGRPLGLAALSLEVRL